MVEVVINQLSRSKSLRTQAGLDDSLKKENSSKKRHHHNPTFNHPFTPYDVQIQLMEAIYDAIDQEYKLGIFESPTGTGKTLSIICSTMSWLRDLKREKHAMTANGLEDEDDDPDEPEWVKEAYREKIIGRMLADAKDYENHLEEIKTQDSKMVLGELKEKRLNQHQPKVKRTKVKAEVISLEDSLAPDDYFSDDETKGKSQNNIKYSEINSEVQKLLAQVEGKSTNTEKSSNLNKFPTKIYFSSRTHSQLNQFSDQLRMTEFPSSLEGMSERIKYLPMGSRKQLCINENVSKLKDTQKINDACIDLQKTGGSDKSKCCPYMPNLKTEHDEKLINQFRDLSFAEVHDIEELHHIGKHYNVCPYYSSRQSVELSEIISLPYQLLLQKNSREVLNLSLKDSVVVIDEAHNLMDTITSLNSASVSYKELVTCSKSLNTYRNKFSKKMNSGNRINLAKLSKLIVIIAKFIAQQASLKKVNPGLEVNPSEIFSGTTGDLLNIHSLEKYLSKSKIAYKIESYMEILEDENQGSTKKKSSSSSTPLLFKIKSFLYCLSNLSKSGKLFFDKDSDGGVLMKYLLLDPSEEFKEIVEEAKCVILAGGTMEPVNEFTKFLAPFVPDDKIKIFNCDHIIPDCNLNVYPITGFGNQSFEFSYEKRNDPIMRQELGRGLIRILQNVPYGVVVFFSSYAYLEGILEYWNKTGIYDEIQKVKQIFQESKDATADSTLESYSNLITTQRKGAVLFAVVGGKMSEGINFSDDLARAVVMVGLPFPNFFSGDLIAKRKYIEQKTIEDGGSSALAKENSKDFYENICMKAVNQSVGRAIRNINDYAVIYLLDARYNKPNIQKKLSGWIQKRLLRSSTELEDSISKTVEFFKVSR
ncbi:hypothetical protein CANARDRAFT_8872 [[Candida] arabinofermentans NRRL YB-2248]|uniref:ATP-dependent DNA helicase CHL1 n=1 Tax=[Candida] arabinofermentans NRRL YB-2248 TaxID=983967 RepID=A0A1E4SXI8_9ASCO|nr:hypothetical protein CANARDRAFT_8872 [[Candida] arabinofermentans NRRL YB-2248]